MVEKYKRGDLTEDLGGKAGCSGSNLGYIACGNCSPDPLDHMTIVYYRVRKVGLRVLKTPDAVGVDVLECPICGHQVIR